MGGEIGFESTRGAGSTFWFRMPLDRTLGSGPPSWMPLEDAGRIAHRQDRRKLRVLVVDDRAANRAVAQGMLEGLGYTVETVESGDEALARHVEQPFDAVLLDSEMPGLDGRETCRRLRRKETGGRHVPVIAITAHRETEEREVCLAAGMDDCLVKPFQAAALAAVLDRWLGIEAADGLDERLEALRALPAGTQAIEAFLQQGENDLAAMRRALLQRDGAALAEAAHGLYGSAAVLGARELAESTDELAILARLGTLEGCAAWLLRVESDFRDAAGRMRG